jgi:hypothetical protein
MEKIKIRTAVDSGRKTKDGKPVIEITLEDGRSGSGFDEKLLSLNGQEVELEVKEAPDYNGQKRHWINLPKPANQQQGKFPAKDWSFEKRKVALECAVSVHAGGVVLEDKVIATANNFFTFLNHK